MRSTDPGSPGASSVDRDSLREFRDLVWRFDHAMLVTRRDGRLRSRPMAIVDVSGDARLSFFTHAASGKLDELAADPNVNVALQDGARYCSVSGVARVVADRDRVAELWVESQRAWFPNGPDDTSLVLLDVEPELAEYWDRSGVQAIAYALSTAKAIVSGEPLDDDDAGRHEKLVLGERHRD